MGQVTNEQVNLYLRLFELRREPRLREARDWFGNSFRVTTPEEMMKLCPPGSKENTFMRMVVGYWEMVASIVNRNQIDPDFYFENSGEEWMVWERVKPVLTAWRTMFKNPHVFANLEEHVKRMEAWREKRAPGSTDAMRQFIKEMDQQAAKATSA
jgi:hypothetical protein